MDELKAYQSKKMIGVDTNQVSYQSIDDFWRKELNQGSKEANSDQANQVKANTDKWYTKQKRYWDKQATTDSGMLSGLEDTHDIDIDYNIHVLELFKNELPSR